jgi:hypothetical protein
MLLAKKLLRELVRQKGQALAVLSVTAHGVLLFVASSADPAERFRRTSLT